MSVAVWQVSVRIVMVSSALGAVLLLSGAAESPMTTGGVLLFTAVAAGAAVRPDSHVGLPFLAAFGWYWSVNVDDSLTFRALLAAMCLATFHTAVAAASLTPWRAPGNRDLARRWLVRLAIVWIGTAIVWTVAEAMDSWQLDGRAVPFGAALIIVVGLAWLLTSASMRRDDAPSGVERRSTLRR